MVEQSGESSQKGKIEEVKKVKSNQYACRVSAIDGSNLNVVVDKSCKGEVLFSNVVRELGVTQKEYLGLMFTNSSNVRCWLDLHKDMKHQVGDAEPKFEFRVKFYEPEPVRVKDEFSRYLLYLQLREDLVTGRLISNDSTYAILGSFTAQAELSDYDNTEHNDDYLQKYQFSPDDNSDLLQRIHSLHKEHRGQTPAQAELNFLEVAKRIPKYGVDSHNAYDDESGVDIAIAALGINVYRKDTRESLLLWQNIDVLTYKKRKFTAKVKQPVHSPTEEGRNRKPKQTYHFTFDSAKKCKQCYKSAVEYHTFFRLREPDSPRKKTDSLKLGSSFRYSDRTLYQLRQLPEENGTVDHPFTRKPSTRDMKKEKEEPVQEEDEVQSNVAEESEEPKDYEEVEIHPDNPNDELYDPKEWSVHEVVLPNGAVKKVRRRKRPVKRLVVSSDGQVAPAMAEVAVEEVPVQYEEVELNEELPHTMQYDPQVWKKVDKKYPNGEVQHMRRRVLVMKTKKYVPGENGEKMDVLEELPIKLDTSIKYEEKEVDSKDPTKYDKKEWKKTEKKFPDGEVKKIRRRTVAVDTERFVVRDKDTPADRIISETPTVEEDAREGDVVEINKDGEPSDPKEWEVVYQTFPDGSKRTIRRRVNPKPQKLRMVEKDGSKAVLADKSVVYVDAVVLQQPLEDDISSDNEDLIEIAQPDGTSKKVKKTEVLVLSMRSAAESLDEDIIVEDVPYDDLVTAPVCEEEPLSEAVCEQQYEEVEIDEENAEPFDEKEWEVVEKTLPNGVVKKVRRRLIVIRKAVPAKPADESDDTSAIEKDIDLLKEIDAEVEEHHKHDQEPVEQPDQVTLEQPNQVTVEQPDQVTVEKDQGTLEEHDGPPVIEISCHSGSDEAEELSDLEDFDPKEWEVVEKTLPDGSKKKVRRRIVVITKIVKKDDDSDKEEDKHDGKEDDKENKDEEKGESNKSDSEPTLGEVPDICVVPDVHLDLQEQIDEPSDEELTPSANVAFKEVVSEDGLCEAEEVQPQYEEVEINEDDPQSMQYDPQEWEVVEKMLPDGTKKMVRRRIIVITTTVVTTTSPQVVEEEYGPCLVEEGPMQYEEVEIEDADELDPKEWELVEKFGPDGEVRVTRRRMITVKTVRTKRVMPDGTEEDTGDGSKLVVEVPVEYEELSMDEDTPDDYDPTEWEVVERVRPDMQVKRSRRRIIVKPVNKVRFVVRADGTKQEVNDCDLQEEGALLFHILPHNDQQPLQPNEEVVTQPLTNGTTIRVRRRFIPTRQVQTTRIFIHADGTREVDSLTTSAPQIEEEIPVQCQEEEVTENEAPLDENEWAVIEVPDKQTGALKKVRRRVVPLKTKVYLCRPDGSKEEVCDDEGEEGEGEEIEIDEDEDPSQYDPQEWVIEERLQQDGSTKKYRRKRSSVIVTPQTTTQQQFEEVPVEYEEIELDENIPESLEFNPDDWEVSESVKPDGTRVRVRRRPVVKISNRQRFLMNSETAEKEIDTSMNCILSDINDLEMCLEKSTVASSGTTSLPKPRKREHKDKHEEEMARKLEEDRLREEEAKKWSEERQRQLEKEKEIREANAAALSHIFTLPEDDVSPPVKEAVEAKEPSDFAFGEIRVNIQADHAVQQAPLRKKKPPPVPAKRHSHCGDLANLERRYNRSITEPTNRHSFHAERKSSLDNTPASPVSPGRSHGNDQDDYHRPHGNGPNTEVIYTVTDVSNVEQGKGGFVRAVKEKHDMLAKDDQHTRASHIPKGHVSTRTMSFNENTDADIRTRTPPTVPVNTTLIRPASSELPDDDQQIITPTNQLMNESHPDELLEATNVPEVETHPVVFSEPIDYLHETSVDQIIVSTTPLQMPAPSENNTASKGVILSQNDTPSQDGGLRVIEHTFPTEVITRTIVVEGDTERELTAEELEQLMQDQQVTTSSVTTTVQQVITGQTITVSDDATEEEIQQAIQNAVESSEADGSTVTSVQTYDLPDQII